MKIKEDHSRYNSIEPYDAIDIAAQYTDEDLSPVANQLLNSPEELYITIIDYIPKENRDDFKRQFMEAYKLTNVNTLKETKDSDIYNTLYNWIEIFGGKDLLASKNITNGIWLKDALQNGNISIQDIENVTYNNTNKKFSDLPMYKKISKNLTETKMKNKLKGGKGDKLTIDDVNPYELRKGIKIEMEHTDNKEEATEIALDHLAEDPMYYTNLQAAIKLIKSRNDLPIEIKSDKKLNKVDKSLVDKKNAMEDIKISSKNSFTKKKV